jgi:hypothetical protein
MSQSEPSSALEGGNTQSISENSEQRKMIKDRMQADTGFEFEEETKESSNSTEKGMTIHQRLAARIS